MHLTAKEIADVGTSIFANTVALITLCILIFGLIMKFSQWAQKITSSVDALKDSQQAHSLSDEKQFGRIIDQMQEKGERISRLEAKIDGISQKGLP